MMKKQSVSPGSPLKVMLLSWLLPGYGFMRHGRLGLGIFFFLVLEGVFLVGATMKASVFLPEMRYGSEGFNVVTILTSLTQLFNGLLGIISLLPEIFSERFAILPYDETSKWADLGSFYLLVSGGMNYFVLVSTYDHFYGRKRAAAAAAAPVDIEGKA